MFVNRHAAILVAVVLAIVATACGQSVTAPSAPNETGQPSAINEPIGNPACQLLVDAGTGGESADLVFAEFVEVAQVKEWQLSRGVGERVAAPLLDLEDGDIVEVCAFHGDFSSVPSPGPGREWVPPNAAYLFVLDKGRDVWLDIATSVEEMPPPPAVAGR